MSAATTTIIGLSVAAATTGAQLYGAKRAADTAKSVGQQQQASANLAGDRAYAAMQQGMDYTRQNQLAMNQSYQPYLQMGAGAMNKLGAGMGIPSGMGSSSGGAMPGAPQGPGPAPMGGQNFLSPGMSQGQPSAGSAAQGALGHPGTASPGGMGSPQSWASQTPVTGMNPGMVMLEAPTGERRAVPKDQAQALIARGARQVQ